MWVKKKKGDARRRSASAGKRRGVALESKVRCYGSREAEESPTAEGNL